MSYSSIAVSNRFIELAQQAGSPLTPLQAIKLTYIAHGWSLALLDRPLVSEGVEAWRYGPVLPDLYRLLKHFGSGVIRKPLNILFSGAKLQDEDRALIEDVYKKYGHLSGIQLSSLTHAPGTPWYNKYREGQYHIPISDESIRDHYLRLADA